ncbi:hypothetical protein [Mycobacteroides abscessus]|uniref:hypothetical protein n=1 Tax=Mycobacteroides abscessus TaxID=36809 RepID=UPI000929E75F|nr:hypothetical protein [Mycobacteroides abscessus]SHQ48396.1 Uncharacterised protein [Mycobacteroides abscessus subsp. abscessus]SKQ85455.1 Uncharacterised protein [Mycobacteroides abscessus subsp. massiliense]SLC49020.1 Uncharacterised protein [Mycobacteroides abscessus subsp. massiliense]
MRYDEHYPASEQRWELLDAMAYTAMRDKELQDKAFQLQLRDAGLVMVLLTTVIGVLAAFTSIGTAASIVGILSCIVLFTAALAGIGDDTYTQVTPGWFFGSLVLFAASFPVVLVSYY